jgi:hypothetical protein
VNSTGPRFDPQPQPTTGAARNARLAARLAGSECAGHVASPCTGRGHGGAVTTPRTGSAAVMAVIGRGVGDESTREHGCTHWAKTWGQGLTGLPYHR